jgi:hypothetical protein
MSELNIPVLRPPCRQAVIRKLVAAEVIVTRFIDVGKAKCDQLDLLLTCSVFVSV